MFGIPTPVRSGSLAQSRRRFLSGSNHRYSDGKEGEAEVMQG
jgi:hypothetical protein